MLTAWSSGTGRSALISGVPGSGKTSLLRALSRAAERDGAVVLHATATPTGRHLPLGVVGQLLSRTDRSGAQRDQLAAVTGPAGWDPRPPVPCRTFARVWRTVRCLAESAPVVVAVDDLQYMDAESTRCLLYLTGRMASSRFLLLLAGHVPPQPVPAPPVLGQVRRPGCTPLTLNRLSEDDIADLFTGILGGGTGDSTASWAAPTRHRAGGGHRRLPSAFAVDTRTHRPGPVVCRPRRPVVGSAFRHAVTPSMRRPGPDTAAVARAAVVLGPDLTPGRIARLLDSPGGAVTSALAALTDAGLLTAEGRGHGMPTALLDEIPPDERAALHARAAVVLYEDGASPTTVARHLMTAAPLVPAGPGLAPWAVAVLEAAAEEALRSGDAERAVAGLRLAHRLCTDEADRIGLLVALVRAESELDPSVASRRLPPLVKALNEGRVDARRAAVPVAQMLWHGYPEEARDVLEGLEEREEAHREPWLTEMWSWLAHVYPDLPGTGRARVRGRPFLGDLLAQAADEDLFLAAERVLQSVVLRDPPPFAQTIAALLGLTHAGQPRLAGLWVRRLAPALERGTPVRRALLAATVAVVHCSLGDHPAAADQARTAFALLPHEGWGVAVGFPVHAAALAATAQGRHDVAADLFLRPVPKAMFRTPAAPYYLFARGRHHLAQRRFRAALGDFHACRDLVERWGFDDSGALPWRAYTEEALRALDGPARASGPLAQLSDAERRVALLAHQGHTNRAIAARLFVTASTVEQHLTRVYRKLGLKGRSGLVDLLGPAASGGA